MMKDLIPGIFGFRHVSGIYMEMYSTEDWQGNALKWHFPSYTWMSLSFEESTPRPCFQVMAFTATLSSGVGGSP
jgi:hypothetical protein